MCCGLFASTQFHFECCVSRLRSTAPTPDTGDSTKTELADEETRKRALVEPTEDDDELAEKYWRAEDQAGTARATTTRTTEGTRAVIDGTSAAVDGMMAVIQRLAHNRQKPIVGGPCADEAGGRRPAGAQKTRRAIPNAIPTSRRRRRSSGSEGQRYACERGRRRWRTPTPRERAQRERDNDRGGMSGDEGGKGAGPHTLPDRNSGRDERDSWRSDAGQEAAHSVSECKTLDVFDDRMHWFSWLHCTKMSFRMSRGTLRRDREHSTRNVSGMLTASEFFSRQDPQA